MFRSLASFVALAAFVSGSDSQPIGLHEISFENDLKTRSFFRGLTCDRSVKCINFDDMEKGAAVDDTTPFVDGVVIRARRYYKNGAAYNDGMVFDGTSISGRDFDLGNFKFLKKMLIISADNDAADPDDAGVGGEIQVIFPYAVQMNFLRFVDLEIKGGDVTMFDQNGDKLRGFKMPTMLNGGQKSVNMSLGGVWSLKIRLMGSGGLDDVKFSQDC